MRPSFSTLSAITASVFISLAVVRPAAAITVTVNAGLGLPSLVDSAGNAVADGNQVQLGYFTSGFDIGAAAAAEDLAALGANWNLFGSTEVMTIFGESGRLGDDVSNIDPSFDGQDIFWWVFDTSDDMAPLMNFGNVVEYGIFAGTLSNWAFPVEGSATPWTLTSSLEVNQFFHSNLDGNGNLQLQVRVPESATATAWLFLGAVTLLLGFRHRRLKGARPEVASSP